MQTQQEQESPRSSLEQRHVIFRTTHQVQYGDVIKVVGQGPQLGKWEVGHAPGMLCMLKFCYIMDSLPFYDFCSLTVFFLCFSSHGVVRRG